MENENDSGLVEVTAEAGKEMLIIKQALQAYNQKDIFNRDETGLFWKMIPH